MRLYILQPDKFHETFANVELFQHVLTYEQLRTCMTCVRYGDWLDLMRLVSKGDLATWQDVEWGEFDAQHAGLGSAGHQGRVQMS